MGILAALSKHTAPLLCGLLGLYIISKIVVYARLRRFAGPAWTGFTDWPHSRAMLRNNCHEWYAGISERYGARHPLFCVLHAPHCTGLTGPLTAAPTRIANTSAAQVRSRGWRRGSSSRPLPMSGCMCATSPATSAPTGTITPVGSSTGGIMSLARRTTGSTSEGGSRWPRGYVSRPLSEADR